MQRVTHRLTLECDNRCVFCAQRGLEASADASASAVAFSHLRERSDELTFIGGEPALAPDLLARVAEAKTAGFRRIGLQTNGRRLAEPGFAGRLAMAGLTDVHLSIHGADAALHDFHAGSEGALDKALLALGAARAARLDVVVTTVVTRSNFRHLAPLARLLKSSGVAAWGIRMPSAAGEAASNFDRVFPRLGLAMPFVLHAIDSAQKQALPAFVFGAPACLLGPFATRLVKDREQAYAATCEGCAQRAACPGVDSAYLARFKGDELRAAGAPLPASTRGPELERLLRMFVGEGESVPGALPAHVTGQPPKPAVLTPLTIASKPS